MKLLWYFFVGDCINDGVSTGDGDFLLRAPVLVATREIAPISDVLLPKSSRFSRVPDIDIPLGRLLKVG